MSKKMKEMSRETKLVLMLLYLLAAWILFSQSGFLPRFISFPVKQEKQQFTHIYNRMGYSETFFRIHKNDKSIVEKGAIKLLGFLRNENIGGRAYYSEKNDLYYVSDNKAIYTVDKSENRKPVLTKYFNADSFVRYGNYLIATYDDRYTITLINSWSRIRSIDGSLDNLTYTYQHDKTTHEVVGSEFNYKAVTGILDRNETEKISLVELAAVMNAASDGPLDYWDSDQRTALFHTCDDDGNREIYSYTVGDEEKKVIGCYTSKADDSWYPVALYKYLVWERGDEGDSLYTFDCKTNEKTKLTDAPVMSQIRYRVKNSGMIAVAGIVKFRDGTADVFVYDGDADDTLTIHLRVLYEKVLYELGKDSLMIYTVHPDDKEACTIYHTPLDIMKKGE